MPFEPPRVVLLEDGVRESGELSPFFWTLQSEMTWTGEFRRGHGRVKVPAGFVTDLASVPVFLTWIFPRYGKYTKAAILHDYLCHHIGHYALSCGPRPPGQAVGSPAGELTPIRVKDRSDADEVLRHLMREREE